MTQETRVTKLEAANGTQGQCVIARVPAHWDDSERKEAIQRISGAAGAHEPFQSVFMPDAGAQDIQLLFAGNLFALLHHVAENSSRIGVSEQEAVT